MTSHARSDGTVGKKTALDKLNDLISFYEAHKPNSGKEIAVQMSPKDLCKMLGQPAVIEMSKSGREVETWPSR